jgi:hypothetical protein
LGELDLLPRGDESAEGGGATERELAEVDRDQRRAVQVDRCIEEVIEGQDAAEGATVSELRRPASSP